jgi:hypothetical protein
MHPLRPSDRVASLGKRIPERVLKLAQLPSKLRRFLGEPAPDVALKVDALASCHRTHRDR